MSRSPHTEPGHPTRLTTRVAALSMAATLVVGLSACGSSSSSGAKKSGGESSPTTSSAGGGSGSASPKVTNPCKLLSATDAATLSGKAVTQSAVDPDPGPPTCKYESATGDELFTVIIEVDVSDEIIKPTADPNAKKVPGVGDVAYSSRFLGFTALFGTTAVRVDSLDDPQAIKIVNAVAAKL